jgi:hypothetical protein
MVGVSLLMLMVVVAASAADIYISDVVDVKIGDGENNFEILTLKGGCSTTLSFTGR